jgi:hypothetical protein
MIACPHCGAAIQEDHLFCSACLALRSFKELLARQRELLPGVAAGNRELRVAKVVGNVTHILLFGSDRQSWCGAIFDRYKISYCLLPLTPPGTCSTCREQLLKAIETAQATV